MVASIESKRNKQKQKTTSSSTNDSFSDNNWRGFVNSIVQTLATLFVFVYFGANFKYACDSAHNPNFIASDPGAPPYAPKRSNSTKQTNNQTGGRAMNGGYKGVYDTEWEIYAPSKNTYMNWYRSSWKRSDSSVSGLLESFPIKR